MGPQKKARNLIGKKRNPKKEMVDHTSGTLEAIERLCTGDTIRGDGTLKKKTER